MDRPRPKYRKGQIIQIQHEGILFKMRITNREKIGNGIKNVIFLYDCEGFYDRPKLEFKGIEESVLQSKEYRYSKEEREASIKMILAHSKET